MVRNDKSAVRSERVYNNASYLDEEYRKKLADYFNSTSDTVWKLQNFPKYVPRQSLTRFITRYELFKKVLNVQGSVIEVGVLGGGSLMSWAQLSSIMEYLNYQRRIVGFDVFGENVSLSEQDKKGTSIDQYEKNEMGLDSYEDIMKAIDIFDMNRFLPNESKVELVKGLAENTIPEYVGLHPELVVSLLYLDVNLYAPTKAALEHIVPRMPKGAIIIFDEINDHGLPGETMALEETIGIRNLRIERFSFDTKISYAVL